MTVGRSRPHVGDRISFTVRTEVPAQRFALNDRLPVWSTLDNKGAGSPMSAIYHKLYNYVAALAYLALGNHRATPAKHELVVEPPTGTVLPRHHSGFRR